MRVISVSNVDLRNKNTSFNAALKVTQAAKDSVYKSNSQNTVVSSLIFNRAMTKFESMLYGRFPFADNVFFDVISKKTKSAHPHTASRYEMRLHDKAVDYNFDHNRIFYNQEDGPIEDRINREADRQAGYLFDTYLHLCNQVKR